MGPSGSGKTTLLNTLARQVACQKNLDLAGNLLVNGQPIETANFRQGYVQQEDMFFSQLTVRYTCHGKFESYQLAHQSSPHGQLWTNPSASCITLECLCMRVTLMVLRCTGFACSQTASSVAGRR